MKVKINKHVLRLAARIGGINAMRFYTRCSDIREAFRFTHKRPNIGERVFTLDVLVRFANIAHLREVRQCVRLQAFANNALVCAHCVLPARRYTPLVANK